MYVLHTAHCTVHTSQYPMSTLHSTHCTLHSTHCTVHTAQYPMSTLHGTQCPHCTVHSAQYTLHSTHSKVPNVHTAQYTMYTLHTAQYTLHSTHCTVGVAQKSRIILRTELHVPYRSGINAAKFQRKIMTDYPPANAVLCLHLNNSTSELCRDTWQSSGSDVTIVDALSEGKRLFQLLFDKSNKLLRYDEFSILR